MVISINAMLLDGGYRTLQINKKMLSDLAESIQKHGFEYVSLTSGVIEIVGFVVSGSLVGDRVIILGNATK
jgi:NADPH:quinone reductase-like Zn-dependent oxidoreductase